MTYGNWKEDEKKIKMCLNGIIGTTKQLIHEHPRSFYSSLADQVNKGSATEAGHFLERAMGKTFAAGENLQHF